MLALGTGLPGFDLPQVTGGRLNNSSLDQRPVLLMVLCAHCPFVKHVEPELTRLDLDFSNAVQLVGVSSNSLITHPQDCLLYTSPSPRDATLSRMPSSA